MKSFFQRFIVWLLGLTTIMRYFVIALLVHVGLVVVLGSIKIVAIVPKIVAAFNPPPLPPSLEDQPEDAFAAYRDFDYNGPTMGEGGGLGGKGPGGAPTAAGENRTASILDDTKSTEAAAVNEVIGVLSDSATAIARPSVGPSGVGMAPSGLGDALAGTGGIKGPGGGVLGARMGAARATNLKAHGGSQRTEQSVLAALRWLKKNQKPNGSWDPDAFNPAVSGLAVLAFLGHGENADSAEFGTTVSKGIEYIVKSVPANGNIGNMYSHGIVGITLAEALSLTGSPVLREPLEKVIKVIVDGQKTPKRDPLHKWGWRYASNSDSSDLSVSGWQIMALKSARNAGVKIPEEVFEHAAEYVWNQYGGNGFGYAGPQPSWSMTGVGTLCEIFLGNGKDRRIDKALDMLNTNAKVNWESPPAGWHLYGWYYATLSLFQGSAMRGGGHWPTWNKQFQKAIVEAQSEDGHLEVPPKSTEAGYGKTYSTAFCTLMLEVYYRYLPLYQVVGTGGGGPASRDTGGNLPTSGGPPS